MSEQQELPQRVVTRMVVDFIVAVTPVIAQSQGGDLSRGVVFLALMQGNQSSLVSPGAADDSKSALKPISVNALAQSLRMPHETARRHVLKLAAAGHCIRIDEKGYLVPDSVFEQPWFHKFSDRCYAAFVQMIGDLKAIGFDFETLEKVGAKDKSAARNAQARASLQAVSGEVADKLRRRIVIDFLLRIVECGIPLHNDDLLAAIIYGAIMSANAKMITNDPVNAWRYASHQTPPPDALRKPVSVLHIATLLNIPYETVRRRVGDLVRCGRCVRVGKSGILLRMADLQSPAVLQSGSMFTLRFVQAVGALRRVGFDFDAIETPPRTALAAE